VPEALKLKPPSSFSKAQLATNDDHDALAVYFTIVKLLFVTGRLADIPPLVALLEPARRGRDLGMTLVRNEHAYYVCISQVLCDHPDTNPDTLAQRAATATKDAGAAAGAEAQGDPRTVYVCGDSHSLCPSWRTLQAGERTVRLASALVTGLKHWHMRPESSFYPRLNLFHVLDTIPRGAHVMFLFGEIDCREGILLSVEKGRYKTLEEGAEVCVDIFLRAIQQIISHYGFVVYVHPIVPVLNETRAMVKIYNRIFHRKVQKVPNLKWLDFFGQMLTPAGDALRPEYALDGTHLSPAYLKLVEAALHNVMD